MKKLYSFALCALVTSVMAVGAGSVFAQQIAGQGMSEQQSTQHDQDARQAPQVVTEDPHSTQRAKQSDGQNRGYMASVPANGIQGSDLIGAEVKTTADEDVGSVEDLIIGENGQVVAIVVGAGGYLGLGERDVAIGWDDVTKSVASDELELRINATREDLSSAPEFKAQD